MHRASEHVEPDHPLDPTEGLLPARFAWIAAISATLVAAVATAAWLTGAATVLAPFAGVIVLAAASRWRAARLSRAAVGGGTDHRRRLHVRVQEGTPGPLRWLGPEAVLSIDAAQVRLDGLEDERWDATEVRVRNDATVRALGGLTLLTPNGPRYVSFVSATDPAAWFRNVVDRRMVEAVEQAIASQRRR